MENLEKEILFNKIDGIYKFRMNLYNNTFGTKDDNGDNNSEAYELFLSYSLYNLLEKLYQKDLFFDLGFLKEKTDFLIEDFFSLELSMAKYFILTDRNFVLPLMKAKEKAKKLIEKNSDLKILNFTIINLLLDIKVEFMNILYQREINDNKNISDDIYDLFIYYLSLTFVLFAFSSLTEDIFNILNEKE